MSSAQILNQTSRCSHIDSLCDLSICILNQCVRSSEAMKRHTLALITMHDSHLTAWVRHITSPSVLTVDLSESAPVRNRHEFQLRVCTIWTVLVIRFEVELCFLRCRDVFIIVGILDSSLVVSKGQFVVETCTSSELRISWLSIL